MSHADSKIDQKVRRTSPVARNHGGPVSMVAPAGSTKSYPPPPPLAALRSRPAPAPAGTEPLAFVPQWEEIPDPMRPAAKRGLAALWLKVAAGSVAAGALFAAGYFGAQMNAPKYEPRLLQLTAAETARPLTHAAPVLTSTAPAAPSSTHLEAPVAAKAPVTLAEKAEPQVKRAASAKPSRSAALKVARKKSITQAPPAPEEQAEEETETPDAELASATKKPKAPALPEQPSRSDVQAGIEQVRPALNTCAAGAHGTVFANITIQGTGKVSYSVVEGEFTSGSVGSCMARALRSASFPQFSGPSLKVRYPFVF